MSHSEERSTIKILFLSADPTEASRLRLGQELRDIREKLQLSRDRNRFHLESRECVRPHDISQFIFDVEPHIIHFAGHSTNAGELCFEDISGNINPIKPDALASLFELLTEDINCVVLNACYSAKQARAIARHIPYVIGMNQEIQDTAAIIFAVGFYKAIGSGKTIDDAFKFGKAELQLLGICEETIPILHKKRRVRDPKNMNELPKEDAETKMIITITGSVKDLNDKFISKLLADFKEMSNDASLKIDKIESGSIKITLSGDSEGLERLAASLKSEKLISNLGIYVKEIKLLSDSSNEAEIKEPELVYLFHEQLELALDIAINQEIRALITKLEKSKNYAPFAQKLIPGLQLYYCEKLSLRDITPKLGMTSWDQARRILNLEELLSKVRTSTVKQLLNNILKKASEKGLTKIPPEPEYLKTLLVQIEAFCDREIFSEAAAEISAANNRSLDSFYAEQLRLYFQQYQ